MRTKEILKGDLYELPPHETTTVPKCEEIRELECEGFLRIVAIEPFCYVVERINPEVR